MRDRLRILVNDAAATLPVGGRPVALLISMVVAADVPGPFTGDPGDIALTVDYSRIARFIVGDLARVGPFRDLTAVGEAVADYTFALDVRVVSLQITLRPAADQGGTPAALEPVTLQRERPDV